MTANLAAEGMDAAENAADARIVAIVDAEIARMNATGREWSCNDLHDRLPAGSSGLAGARVRAAALRKPREMVAVGWVASRLPSTHGAVIRVWRGVGK